MIKEAIDLYLEHTGNKTFHPKAVLFDMDGVLYDSMRFHARAWKEMADRHGLKADINDFFYYEGMTGGATLNDLFLRTFGRDATDEEKTSLYEEKSDLFHKYNDGEAMPGTARVLEIVKWHGLQRIVVTGSGQRSLINKLEHTYPGMFERDKMVTAFDVRIGKPNPEPYLIGLKKAGVASNEAIVVENAPLGVKAGVAAGIFTVGVNTGPLDDKVLLDAGANILFKSMAELADNLPEILKYS